MNFYKVLLLSALLLFLGGCSTLMIYSSLSGNAERMKSLIKIGTDVNTRDHYEKTLLMLASERGHLDVMKVLIEAKADINATDINGYSALMLAVDKNKQEAVKTLIKAKANLDIQGKLIGSTALMLAVDNKNLQIVKLLLNAGANINIQDKVEQSALMYANRNGTPQIAKAIDKAGDKKVRGKEIDLDAYEIEKMRNPGWMFKK